MDTSIVLCSGVECLCCLHLLYMSVFIYGICLSPGDSVATCWKSAAHSNNNMFDLY